MEKSGSRNREARNFTPNTKIAGAWPWRKTSRFKKFIEKPLEI